MSRTFGHRKPNTRHPKKRNRVAIHRSIRRKNHITVSHSADDSVLPIIIPNRNTYSDLMKVQ
jgi:hypothetical protein